MGNRGILHDAGRRLGRARWRHPHWICCRLSFKGRKRRVMTPGRYTELFFLDEATALAAGHRPCFECRREDFRAFQAAWRRAFGARSEASAPAIDRALHAARVEPRSRRQIRFEAALDDLPDGAFALLADDRSNSAPGPGRPPAALASIRLRAPAPSALRHRLLRAHASTHPGGPPGRLHTGTAPVGVSQLRLLRSSVRSVSVATDGEPTPAHATGAPHRHASARGRAGARGDPGAASIACAQPDSRAPTPGRHTRAHAPGAREPAVQATKEKSRRRCDGGSRST